MNESNGYIVRCPSCRAKNKIPQDKVNLTPKCGKCGDAIPTGGLFSGKPIEVTDVTFDSTVLVNVPLPVLVDCWAPWCGPCQMMGPIIDKLAAEWRGRVKVCKLNSDENPMISSRYQIRSIPTLLIFDQGQLKDTLVGAVPKQQIVQKMTKYL